MNLAEILGFLREIAPEETAYEDDPVGLLIEPAKSEIQRIAVCLDATLPVANEAVADGEQLVIAHHPLIYHPLKRLTSDIPSAQVAMALVRAGVGLYAMHTNWDAADGGVNDTLAETLGLIQVRRLAESGPASITRIGELAKAMPLDDFAAYVQDRLGCAGTNSLRRLIGRPAGDTPIRTVAICGGAGASLLPDALKEKADAFVTADIRHDQFLDAAAAGIALIDAGHEATETPGMKALAERVAERFAEEVSVVFLPSGR